MTITLSQVQTLLISRASGRMAAADMDTLTVSVSNKSLADPLTFALLLMDVVPANPTNLVDGDFSTFESTDLPELLDLAELRLLENIVGSATLVDISVGPRKESFSQMITQTEAAITRLNSKISVLYGLGAVGQLEGGVISQDFATKGDDLYAGDGSDLPYPF